MMKLPMVIYVVVGVAAVSACGKKSTKTTTTSPATAGSLGFDDLTGSWSVCSSNGDTPTTYSLTKATYSGTAYTSIYTTFTDVACTAAATSGINSTSTGTVSGGVATTPSGTKTIVTTYLTAVVTPIDAATATSLNSQWTCTPAATFTAGKAIDVKTCTASGAPVVNTDYNIYQVTGDNLEFGDESGDNDGSTTAKQPTTLDGTTVYKKAT